MTNPTTSRDPVDVLRTKYWYEGLCLRLGETTAYALEKKIEPGAFKKNGDNVSIHRNKWWRYRSGLHTPNAATCSKADGIVMGSSADLNHPLWRSLRNEPLAHEAAGLLRQLAPELQIILFEQHDNFRIEAGKRYLGRIEHRASLDALACLTILLKVNYEKGHYDQVWDFAHRVLRMLLILGDVFDKRKIAEEIFEVYRKRIFNLVRLNGERFCLDGYCYLGNVAILHHYAHNTNYTKGRSLTWNEQVKFMRRILDGDFGMDLRFLLMSSIRPDLSIGPPTCKSMLRKNQSVRLRKWSLQNVVTGGSERFPPANIWED
ncbi:hypothetical protein [Undibacterium luofuense]|uniref:Uncharacterized protein n=1 Tax=Undibacterium luofuense TaxID=2828733 RepID=A0A941I7Z2_9BURK|nr:hypothetical protein [Undibacterium luofuense]MBR7782333.1 hypothetical protein [Undibacterium luofuense]